MLMKEFIATLLQKLPQDNLPSLLQQLLNQYKNSNEEATRQNLKPFQDLLTKRWESIKKDDNLSYTKNPHTPSTRIYYTLASCLVVALNAQPNLTPIYTSSPTLRPNKT